MRKGKPSFEDIKELLADSEKKCEHLFEKFEEDQRYYELDFQADLDIPIEYKSAGVVLPTARDMVDTYVDHIDIANARVFANKKGIYKINEEEAEMMRKFYLGVLFSTNVESDISPWRVGAKHYAVHGLTVIRTLWDADRWPDKPEKKEGESEDAYAEKIDQWRYETHLSIPIDIQAINPHNIIPDPSYGGRLFVFELHKKICLSIKENPAWSNWTNPKNKKLSEEVDFGMYWSRNYKCYFADGEPLLKVKGGVVPHLYGFIPYVFIDSGLGNISYDAKPEMRYVGQLRYIYDLLKAESRDFSIADIVLAKNAWPWFTLEGDDTNLVEEVRKGFGVGTVLPTGVTLTERVQQMPPEALNLHLARTSDFISSHAAPRSVRGLSEIGVRSGAHYREITSEASARFRYSTEAFKNGAAKVLINCAKLFKNVIPGDMRVWARTPVDEFDVVIKKDKMKEPFTCYVEFAPISEEDEYRRQDALLRLAHPTMGIVPKSWARKQMSNVDPIAMGREDEKEKLRNSPNYMAIKEQYLLSKFAQSAAGRTQPPAGTPTETPPSEFGGRMVPGVPERAPIGSAEYMQQQLEQLRGKKPVVGMQGFGGGGSR